MIGWVSYDNLPKGQLFLAGSGWQLGFSGKQSNDAQSARERHNETWAGPRCSREGNQVGLEQPGLRILNQGQERTGPPRGQGTCFRGIHCTGGDNSGEQTGTGASSTHAEPW